MVDREETKSDKKREGEKSKTSGKNRVAEGDETGPDFTGLYDYLENLHARLKAKNYYIDFFKPKETEIDAMVVIVEEKTNELFIKIKEIIDNFLQHEVKKLNNQSDQDFEKIKTVLTEYKSNIEKIFVEQLKSITDIKDKLQKKVMRTKELKQFIQLTETRMNHLKKITNDLMDALDKPQLDVFKQNLQNTIGENSDKIMSEFAHLLDTFKKAAREKSTAQKLPVSEIKIPQMQSKKFQSSKTAETVPKPFISPEIRQKLQKFSFTRHFNSETATGRANVARLTIFGMVLGFLYWRRKRSKVQQ